MFGPLKGAIEGNKLRSDEVDSMWCVNGCADDHKNFFLGIHTLCKCWRACIERNGDYVEKVYSCVPLSLNTLNLKKNYHFHLTHPRNIYMKPWSIFA
jgi:hypothetical protein